MPDLPPERHDHQFQMTDWFRRAVARWEEAPHNKPGTDKMWVERLDRQWREHYRHAVRVR